MKFSVGILLLSILLGCNSGQVEKKVTENVLVEVAEETTENNIAPKEDVIEEEIAVQTEDGIHLKTGWYFLTTDTTFPKRILSKTEEVYYIIPEPFMTKADMKTIIPYQSNSSNGVIAGISMVLTGEGNKKYAAATEEKVDSKIAFVLNNELIATPIVYNKVDVGVANLSRTDFSPQEIYKLADEINKSE